MGIENLLNFLKPALQERSIVDYRGKTAAVDAMSWLYRGCYSCAYDLNQDIKTNDYIYYIQKMISMMREYQIKPILIFDGRKLKAKEKTEQMRKQIKTQNLEKGKEFLKAGNETEAKRYFQRCLKITKQMLYTTFDVLKELEVDYIVAPYEADSQIAHLCLTGQADFAVTEDSDLICYKCPLIVFKLKSDGSCFELELEKLRSSKANRAHIANEDVRQFFAFSDEVLVDACIMSGCDYVPSVRGVGIKKAINLLNKYEHLSRTIHKMRKNKLFADKVPKEYERVIQSTRLIFQYQTVYDLIQKQWVQLNQVSFDQFISQEQVIPANQIPLLIGEKIVPELQIQFCSGDLDIKTLAKRERVKIDFIKLFQRIERKLQYSQTQIIDLDAKKKVAEFIQNGGLQNLPEFDDQPAEKVQQFVPAKRTQEPQDIDVFQICDELFERQKRTPTIDDLEVDDDFAVETEKKYDDNDEESNQFNPFANKTQIKNYQCLSQLKSNQENLIPVQKKCIEKVLKQTQSTLKFVKK